jgi:hypothetical protein
VAAACVSCSGLLGADDAAIAIRGKPGRVRAGGPALWLQLETVKATASAAAGAAIGRRRGAAEREIVRAGIAGP